VEESIPAGGELFKFYGDKWWVYAFTYSSEPAVLCVCVLYTYIYASSAAHPLCLSLSL
jgi:hypothetical protein